MMSCWVVCGRGERDKGRGTRTMRIKRINCRSAISHYLSTPRPVHPTFAPRQGRRQVAKVTHIPTRPPLQSLMIINRPPHAQRQTLEPPERAHYRASPEDEPYQSGPRGESARGEEEMVEDVAQHQDCEVERGQVMVEVRYAAHDEEGDCCQRGPARSNLVG